MSTEKSLNINRKSVVICIAAYNEEKSIGRLIIDLKKYSDKIIIVDDGSSDYTSNIARALGAVVLRHEQNLGKGAALRTAFTHAITYSPDVVITMDGDGQHDPIFIPKLVEPIINKEADVVIGSRDNKKTKMPKHRKAGLKVINYLSNKASGTQISDTQSGYRAYSNNSISCLKDLRFDDYQVEFEQLRVLVENGFEIKEIPVDIKYEGLEKTSKKNFLSHGGELVFATLFRIIERRPILYLAIPGGLFLSLALFYGSYTIFLFNTTRYFSMPMSVMSGILLILGTLFIFSAMFIYITSKMRQLQK